MCTSRECVCALVPHLIELNAALEALLRLFELSKVEVAHAHVVQRHVVLPRHAASVKHEANPVYE